MAVAAAADPDLHENAQGQFSFEVGGKQPTDVSLRMTGGKIDVSEEFEKGQLVEVTYLARVGAVEFIDKTDPKTKQVIACERRQKLRPESVTVKAARPKAA